MIWRAEALSFGVAVGAYLLGSIPFGLILTRLAAERQLNLSISLRNFLLTHLPRTAAALREAVARLDRAERAPGARLNRQIAAELLADLMG